MKTWLQRYLKYYVLEAGSIMCIWCTFFLIGISRSICFKWATIELFFSFLDKNAISLQLTRFLKSQSWFLYLCNSAIKFKNWSMKNGFSILKFPIKIGNWKLKKKVCAPKVPLNFQIKIEMKKGIFAHFIFNSKLKIEKRHFFFNFQFSIFI